MHILNKPFNTLSKVLKELFNSIKLFRNETVPQFLQRITLGPPVSVLIPQPELHYNLLLQLLFCTFEILTGDSQYPSQKHQLNAPPFSAISFEIFMYPKQQPDRLVIFAR